MTDILKLLLKTPTASGSEQQIGEVLSRYLETECGCDVAADGLGNVIAAKRYKGSSRGRNSVTASGTVLKAALVCPIDAPGLIVTHIEKGGLIKAASLGKCDFRSACYGVVRAGKHYGIITPDSDKSDSIDSCHVDFGFTDDDNACKYIHQGDTLYFDSENAELQNGAVCGVGVGAKFCAAALCKTAKNIVPAKGKEFYFIFTTQSLLGLRGSYPASFGVSPDVAVCVEPYEGEKIAVKILDRSLVCDTGVTERLRSAAAQTGIDISLEVRSDDVSDASGVQRAGAGVKTGVLMLPVRNYNSTRQISCKNYSEQVSAITEKFLNNI